MRWLTGRNLDVSLNDSSARADYMFQMPHVVDTDRKDYRELVETIEKIIEKEI